VCTICTRSVIIVIVLSRAESLLCSRPGRVLVHLLGDDHYSIRSVFPNMRSNRTPIIMARRIVSVGPRRRRCFSTLEPHDRSDRKTSPVRSLIFVKRFTVRIHFWIHLPRYIMFTVSLVSLPVSSSYTGIY